MPKEITYHWGESHLLIKLGNRTERRIRVLFLSEFLLAVGMATIFFIQARPLTGGFVHILAAVGSMLLYLLASYRFLSRMFFTEKMLLDKNEFTIITRTPFSHKARSYRWSNVGPLHYIGMPAKTDHPLKGKAFDYFGFETHEHIIRSLHHDGNLCFNYGTYTVCFARGVYSWHAEEVVRIMKLYIGPALKLGPEWERMLQEHEVD
ncbi:MAG: hypothetical protein H0X33_11005 [Taibaiella sp.]|nr:hypothetical protein [Taibaiella sp.]